MNQYFYVIYVPQLILSLVGVWWAISHTEVWWWALGFWVVFGYLGHNIGYHRLLAHRQFKTWRPVELALAAFGTMIAYGPILFWCASHARHHKCEDTPMDPTTPTRGFWHSTVTWNLKRKCGSEIELRSYPVIAVMRDRKLMWMSRHFFLIIWVWMVVLVWISPPALLGYVIATMYERLRIGFVVNWLMHVNVPGSYRTRLSMGRSKNFVLLYPLTMGFSLHNAHHGNPKKLNESSRWWEVGVDERICKALTKNDPLPGTEH